MIRDGKINSGWNEKDWFESETIKKKWRQELVWEGKRKKLTEQEIREAATILQHLTLSSNFPINLDLIDSTHFLIHCQCCWGVPSSILLIPKRFLKAAYNYSAKAQTSLMRLHLDLFVSLVNWFIIHVHCISTWSLVSVPRLAVSVFCDALRLSHAHLKPHNGSSCKE